MEMELLVQRPHKRIYRRGGDLIKLFETRVPAADVLEEALNQELAAEAGLPVPRLFEVTKIDGLWSVISEYVPGGTLQWHMEQHPGQRQELLEWFVRLQMRVHGAGAPRLRRQRDQLHRNISASGLSATARYELHVRLDDMQVHQKICHGDFLPSNVILNEGQPCVLDWAHVTQGNASADAANTYLSLLKFNSEEMAAEYLALYCELSDTARQYVGKWIPIIAGSHLAYCKPEHRAFYAGFCEGIV